MKKVLIVLMFSSVLVLSGCWNRREINDLVIAVGMGIDKVDGKYQLSVQVVDPSEITATKGSGHTPVTLYVSTGKTIFDALREMSSVAARKVYLSHLRMFLIGEEAARTDGIGEILEFLSRDHELRDDFYIVIAKDTTAKELLKALTPIEKIPANKMFTSLETSSRVWSAASTIQLSDLLSDLMSEGKDPVITGIGYIGDTTKSDKKENVEITLPYARLKYEGMAVFNKDKLIGWLDEEESKGYNYLNSEVKSSVGAIRCPNDNGNFSVEINEASSHYKVKNNEESRYLEISINATGSVGEVQCHVDLTDQRTIQQMEELIEENIEKDIRKTLSKSFEMKSDFIGLGAAIHRLSPRTWYKLKEDWSERMENFPIVIKVNSKLITTGKANKSFLEKIKE